MISLTETQQEYFIISTSVIGIIFGLWNALQILRIKVTTTEENIMAYRDDRQQQQFQKMQKIADLIEDGAYTFLHEEYIYMSVFIIVFACLISLTVEKQLGQFWVVVPFLLGAITSIVSGYIGMTIAVKANVRTCKEATFSLHRAFNVAFRGGVVLGFTLVGLALLVLMLLIMVYRMLYLTKGVEYKEMFECIAGYGLGGSTIALFGRVGGGIYTKAADVGSDLVGKVVAGLEEDSPQNPGVIADNVGDNVGDIAGMGSDLFGSFAESSCACLIIASTSKELVTENALLFPLMISAVGIIVCIVTSYISSHMMEIDTKQQVEKSLKYQLIFSTILMTPLLYYLSNICLPAHFTFSGIEEGGSVHSTYAFICTAMGLWGGLIIGYFTEYYTSNAYGPVQKLSRSCLTGAAPNIIGGLALGFYSTIIPVAAIALTIFVSFTLANMYGISLAALGMLSTLAVGLTIDGYGPISDNAGGNAEMCHLEEVRVRTDILDSAGNTTAAIGKGFAIGSACLVALALFGAFVTRSNLTTVNILRPLEFASLVIGAMLPYAFSAMTMNSVGNAAEEMIHEIVRQFNEKEGILQGVEQPDYHKCIEISTKSSIRQMLSPGLLVILSPIVMGFLFGARGVSGLLAGTIASGIQIAISFSNAGGAWDNAKKYIEAGHLIHEEIQHGKKSEAHKAAIIGDTVGDPLKDTSGPAINILIKLMAITSLVFVSAFDKFGGICLKYVK